MSEFYKKLVSMFRNPPSFRIEEDPPYVYGLEFDGKPIAHSLCLYEGGAYNYFLATQHRDYGDRVKVVKYKIVKEVA